MHGFHSELLIDSGRHDEALKVAESLVKRHSTSYTTFIFAQTLLSMPADENGKRPHYEAGLAELKKSVAMDIPSPEAWRLLTNTYRKANDFTEALAANAMEIEAVSGLPCCFANAYWHRAMLQREKGDDKQALADATDIVKWALKYGVADELVRPMVNAGYLASGHNLQQFDAPMENALAACLLDPNCQ